MVHDWLATSNSLRMHIWRRNCSSALTDECSWSLKKNCILNGKEYLENNKFAGDPKVEEMQIKYAPVIHKATKHV